MSNDSDNLLKTSSIAKLDGSNFSNWRNCILTALAYKDLDNLVLSDHNPTSDDSDMKLKKKRATTFIRLHLDHQNFTRFVSDITKYQPKALWDSINAHYATKSMENAANIMDRLYSISFQDNIQNSINLLSERSLDVNTMMTPQACQVNYCASEVRITE